MTMGTVEPRSMVLTSRLGMTGLLLAALLTVRAWVARELELAIPAGIVALTALAATGWAFAMSDPPYRESRRRDLMRIGLAAGVVLLALAPFAGLLLVRATHADGR